jgi:predicted nucleic acid-binding protein
VPAATRDCKDDYLVALALSAAVDAIVSGDHDLLDANLDIAVWSPRELAGRIAAE